MFKATIDTLKAAIDEYKQTHAEDKKRARELLKPRLILQIRNNGQIRLFLETEKNLAVELLTEEKIEHEVQRLTDFSVEWVIHIQELQ